MISSIPARAVEGNRPEPAVDLAPPVSPNLVRPPEVPGARNVGRNTLETLVFRVVSTPLALGLVVLQSRLLHPDGRGTYVLAVLSVTIFARLLGQLGVAVTSKLDEGEVPLRSLVGRALSIAGALGLAGTAAVVAWGAPTDQVGPEVAALAAAGLVPNLVWQTLSGVLLGQARVRLWNWIQVAAPLLTLAATAVLVAWLDLGVRGALGGWALAHAATALVALVAARDLWWPWGPSEVLDRHGRTLLRLALVMGAVQVVNLVSYRLELFVLTLYRGVDDVGVYSIAMQAAESMWLVPAAIATALTAPVVHEDERDAVRLVERSALRAAALTAVVAVVVGAVAPFVIPALLGDAFRHAATPLALLLPGVVVYAPVTILVLYLSVRCERPAASLLAAVAAGAVTLGAAFALVPGHGASGAALASSIGYGAGTLAAFLAFERLRRARR